MSADWSAFHALVVDLGEVCAMLGRGEARLEIPDSPETALAFQAKEDAAAAVHRVLDAGLSDPDEVDATLEAARTAVARARDCIGRLRRTMEANQELRARAERLVRESTALKHGVHLE